MQDEHGLRAIASYEIDFLITDVRAPVDFFWPMMNAGEGMGENTRLTRRFCP